MDPRMEYALLDALGAISKIFGKEEEFEAFISYTRYAKTEGSNPSLEDIAMHTPGWIQLLAPPLRNLYNAGYESGRADYKPV
ncbi:hypothetical protein NTE_01865 [Candidatus Nitrososphaera evergladensis SR1]|uniref:Uncharacterized protein n=1 Tax=Candidatus Nitrososphaera evergladensis SR1 TaxID=1459636 RepID=A0A075MS39_9ARCH|nr:hypothetical protein [Candidatus Nitrososphaera evergladensis]AIF83925.1 hypothetical protein NTE_01865 [Candidatus Nitrososphaera evergladensis SR1]